MVRYNKSQSMCQLSMGCYNRPLEIEINLNKRFNHKNNFYTSIPYSWIIFLDPSFFFHSLVYQYMYLECYTQGGGHDKYIEVIIAIKRLQYAIDWNYSRPLSVQYPSMEISNVTACGKLFQSPMSTIHLASIGILFFDEMSFKEAST